MTSTLTADIASLWRADTQQALYRRILQAFAQPGQIEDLGTLCTPEPAWLGVLAALLDPATTLADPQGLLTSQHLAWLGAVERPVSEAAWILADGRQTPPPGFEPCLGSIIAPESGATLVLCVSSLDQGCPLTLRGPGIADACHMAVAGLDPAWVAARNRWCRDYPLGLEVVLTSPTALVAWPRSTRVERDS